MKVVHWLFIGGAMILPATAFILATQEQAVVPDATAVEVSSPSLEAREPGQFTARDGAKDGEVTAKLLALGKEVALLKTEVSELRSRLQAQRVPAAANTASLPPDPAQEAKARTELRRKEEALLRERGDQLEAAFRQQTTDPVWSGKAETLIQKALAKDKVAADAIVGLDCRATMCRVELSNEADQRAPKIDSFPMMVGNELPNIQVNQIQEADGSTTTVLYLSNDNQDQAGAM